MPLRRWSFSLVLFSEVNSRASALARWTSCSVSGHHSCDHSVLRKPSTIQSSSSFSGTRKLASCVTTRQPASVAASPKAPSIAWPLITSRSSQCSRQHRCLHSGHLLAQAAARPSTAVATSGSGQPRRPATASTAERARGSEPTQRSAGACTTITWRSHSTCSRSADGPFSPCASRMLASISAAPLATISVLPRQSCSCLVPAPSCCCNSHSSDPALSGGGTGPRNSSPKPGSRVRPETGGTQNSAPSGGPAACAWLPVSQAVSGGMPPSSRRADAAQAATPWTLRLGASQQRAVQEASATTKTSPPSAAGSGTRNAGSMTATFCSSSWLYHTSANSPSRVTGPQ
mmetsp:Transcript_45717/g.131083  ORF Transcript_45717/g.131083 Transcript_45717/m.131083 type:complete len:345 (-) Transcript_45717:658-1692(-)